MFGNPSHWTGINHARRLSQIAIKRHVRFEWFAVEAETGAIQRGGQYPVKSQQCSGKAPRDQPDHLRFIIPGQLVEFDTEGWQTELLHAVFETGDSLAGNRPQVSQRHVKGPWLDGPAPGLDLLLNLDNLPEQRLRRPKRKKQYCSVTLQ